MKQIKKLFVVLPLVLVFAISAMPVFAWPKATNTAPMDYTVFLDGKKIDTIHLVDGDFQESKFTVKHGYVDYDELVNFVLKRSALYKSYLEGKVEVDAATEKSFADLAAFLPPNNTAKKFDIHLTTVPDSTVRIVAIEKFSLAFVPTTIDRIENKNNAKSVYDLAHEFFDWEVAHGGVLKDYYFLGFAPDVNGNVTPTERDLLLEHGAAVMIWVVEKIQPVPVTHVFPDRAPLMETIGIDYWVLEKGQLNNANAAEVAKTRIQKMNEQGYVFDRAEYTPFIYRESIIKTALDIYGNKIKTDLVLSTHGIFIYYKGAPIPAPVPADAMKKVDAATAQATPAAAPQANIQAAVASQSPVAASSQLPATGVADNAFLFLSSAALMALGLFFFKKH